MQLLPRTLTLVRNWRPDDVGSLVIWAAGLVAVEMGGRQLQSDLGDALMLAAIGVLVGLTLFWHRRRDLRWVGILPRTWKRVKRGCSNLVPDFGVDLKREPAITAEVPRRLLLTVGLAVALVLVLTLTGDFFPVGLRAFLAPRAYLLHLVILTLLWGLQIAGGLLSLFIAGAVLHDAFANRDSGFGARRLELEAAIVGGAAVLLILGGVILPTWVAWGGLICAPLVSAVLLWWPSGTSFRLLWRRGDGEVRSISWGTCVQLQLSLASACAAALVLLARGDRLFGQLPSEGSSMELLPAAGSIFAWVALVGVTALFSQTVRACLARGRFTRAAGAAPCLFVESEPHPLERKRLIDSMGEKGWKVRFRPAIPTITDVRVRLGKDPVVIDWFAPVPWPRAFEVERLCTPETQRTLLRRREIQLRRSIHRALEKLFKNASRRRFTHGEGFWVGPQHWFVSGLTRDEDDEDFELSRDALIEQIIGPAYERVLSWEARAYLSRVLGALDVDLIFVEDGIRYRLLRRIFEVLYEVYDVHNGGQRIEEKHFSGINGVRVVLHDFQLGNPYRQKGYPEPDYEDLGRARVLHVFKDRGGSQEGVQVAPNERGTRVPDLMPVLL